VSPSRGELEVRLRQAKRERDRRGNRFARARRQLDRARRTSFNGAIAPTATLHVARLERAYSEVEDVVCGLERQLLDQWADDAGAD